MTANRDATGIDASTRGLNGAMDHLFGTPQHRVVRRSAPRLTVERFQHGDAVVDTEPGGQALSVVLPLGSSYQIERVRGGPRRTVVPKPGTVALVRPDVRNTLVIKGRPDILQLHVPMDEIARFAMETLDRDPRTVSVEPSFHVRDPGIERLALALAAEIADGASDGVVGAFADPLIALLMERHSAGGQPLRTPRLTAWQLRRVHDLVEARLPGTPSRAEMAAELGLSEHHFARGFAGATGVPPHRYVLMRRLDIAKGLLAERAHMPIAQVALEAGFASDGHLARAFARHVGATPTAYRRAVSG